MNTENPRRELLVGIALFTLAFGFHWLVRSHLSAQGERFEARATDFTRQCGALSALAGPHEVDSSPVEQSPRRVSTRSEAVGSDEGRSWEVRAVQVPACRERGPILCCSYLLPGQASALAYVIQVEPSVAQGAGTGWPQQDLCWDFTTWPTGCRANGRITIPGLNLSLEVSLTCEDRARSRTPGVSLALGLDSVPRPVDLSLGRVFVLQAGSVPPALSQHRAELPRGFEMDSDLSGLLETVIAGLK